MGEHATGASRARSLAPKEHGAYGQLALPLAAALAGGEPGVAAVCFGTAGVAAFLAHEPLLVIMGRRGLRAQHHDDCRARRRLCWLGALAASTGGVGFFSAPFAAQLLTPLPIGLALLLGILIRSGAEKSARGELLAAATLSSVGALVASASGMTMAMVWTIWGAWCISFASATLAVRTVIAHAREPIGIARRLGGPVAFTAIGLGVVALGVVPAFVVLALAPVLVLTMGLAARPPRAHRLRRIGWTLVGATTFTAVTLAVGSRLGSLASPTSPGGAGRLDVFVRGTDAGEYATGWDGANWSPYTSIGNIIR